MIVAELRNHQVTVIIINSDHSDNNIDINHVTGTPKKTEPTLLECRVQGV